MNSGSTYAFYGYLRKGMRYYEEFKNDLCYHYSFWLMGYEMYSLGPYPFAIKSDKPKSKILVEVMKVEDRNAEKKIYQIEMDAGYYYTDIMIQNKSVGIFLYERGANYPQVRHGDWVKFFGS